MSFAFIQITDHHLRETEQTLTFGFSPAWALRSVLRDVAESCAERADFIISTGDLVHMGTEAEYLCLCRLLNLEDLSPAPGPQRISVEGLEGFPIYFLPGNHDSRELFYRSLFPQSQPSDTMNLSFIHKGVQFICLDWGTEDKGVIQPEMLEFVGRELQTDLPSILLMHHNPVPVGCRWVDEWVPEDVDRFWKVLEGQNVLGILHGHTHGTFETWVGGIPVLGLRSTSWTFDFAVLDEIVRCLRPPHYRLVMVQDGKLSTEIHEVNL